MPRIPVTRQQPLDTNIPSPAGAGRAINTNPGAGQGAQQLGAILQEVGERTWERHIEAEKQTAINRFEQRANEVVLEARQKADPTELPGAVEKSLNNVKERTIGNADLPDHVKNEIAREQITPAINREVAKARRDALKQSQDNAVFSAESRAQTNVSEFARSDSPAERTQRMVEIQQTFRGLADEGIISDEEANQMTRHAFAQAEQERVNNLISRGKTGAAIETAENAAHIQESDRRQLLSLARNANERANSQMDGYVEAQREAVLNTGSTLSEINGTKRSEFLANATEQQRKQFEKVRQLEEDIKGFQQASAESRQKRIQELQDKVQSGNATDKDLELLETYQQRHRRIIERGKKTPYEVSAEAGVTTTPRNLAKAFAENDKEAVGNIIAERQEKRKQVQRHVGRKVSLLTPQEQRFVAQTIQEGDANEAAARMQTLMNGLSAEAQEQMARDLSNENAALGVAAIHARDGNLDVAEDILAGQNIGEDAVDFNVPEARSEFEDQVGDSLSASPNTADTMFNAARKVYRRMAVRNGNTGTFNEDLFRKATRLVANGGRRNGEVVGGPVSYNDATVMAPRAGMDQDTTNDLLDSALQETEGAKQVIANHANGRPGRLNADGEFVEEDPGELGEYVPRYVGNGEYVLVSRNDGKPLQALDENGDPTGEAFRVNLRSAHNSGITESTSSSAQQDASGRNRQRGPQNRTADEGTGLSIEVERADPDAQGAQGRRGRRQQDDSTDDSGQDEGRPNAVQQRRQRRRQ